LRFDTGTERAVQGALETLAESWTTIVLVHRLWTGAPADQFVELDHGRVTESGAYVAV
jgi:ATP-binding cassette subfamily B protein